MDITDEEVQRLKSSLSLKKFVLKDWNIEFKTNSKYFTEVMSYLEKIGRYIPFQFNENGLTIRDFDSENSHWTSLTFQAGEEPSSGFVLSEYKFNSGDDKDYKLVLMDIVGFAERASKFPERNEVVVVRIDTIKTMRAEFVFKNLIMRCELMNPSYLVLPKWPEIMSVSNKGKTSFTVNNADFQRMCGMGHVKKLIKDDNDKWVLFEVNNEDGVYIKSGFSGRGRSLTLSPPLEEIDEEYEQQLLKKEELANSSSSNDKNSKVKKVKAVSKYQYGRLIKLEVEKEESITINIDGFRVLSTLNFVSNIKMTPIKDVCMQIRAEFWGVKIFCAVAAMNFELTKK